MRARIPPLRTSGRANAALDGVPNGADEGVMNGASAARRLKLFDAVRIECRNDPRIRETASRAARMRVDEAIGVVSPGPTGPALADVGAIGRLIGIRPSDPRRIEAAD